MVARPFLIDFSSDRVRGQVLLILLSGCLLAAACRGEQSPAEGSHGTPVIIISVDTLRSDRLPVYGYGGVETPNIDRLRADSVLYERAYTHCPLTLPAHASLFTGLLPAGHGIRDNIGYSLDPEVPTIAEVLKQRGYATGAAVSAYVMRKNSGIARGFDSYDDEIESTAPNQVMGRIQRGGDESAGIAARWIAEQKGRPFFYMLHVYEPHTPYEAPEPYASRYESAYDAEIAWTDEIVGKFIQALRESDVYDDALIIFLSDHGEGLGDHDEDEHGIFLYREAIQIPLLVKLPRQKLKGSSVSTPVQIIDIFPTIVQQTAAASDLPALPGTSLVDLAIEEPAQARMIYSETYYPRFHFGWSDLHSLTDGTNHFIHAPRPELYDLVSDPGEKRNVLEDNRRVYAAMRKEIEPLIKAAAAPAKVDPEEAAKLAALGYLGSVSSGTAGEDLPDPKDKISDFPLIKTAFTYFKNGEYERSIAAIDALLAENGRMLDLWDMKARALERLGRLDDAIEAAKHGLRIAPNASHLVTLIGNLSLHMGRLDQAQSHAELLLASDPAKAHEILARVFLARGDLDAAKAEAERAIRAGQERAVVLVTLGRIEKERGNFQGALARFDEAAEALGSQKKPPLSNLSFLRGDMLARLGRTGEAESAFRQEIADFPSEPYAYKNLVLLYVAEGRTEEATRLIFELEKAAPTPPSYIAIVQTLETIGDERGARFWARKGRARFPNDPVLRKL